LGANTTGQGLAEFWNRQPCLAQLSPVTTTVGEDQIAGAQRRQPDFVQSVLGHVGVERAGVHPEPLLEHPLGLRWIADLHRHLEHTHAHRA